MGFCNIRAPGHKRFASRISLGRIMQQLEQFVLKSSNLVTARKSSDPYPIAGSQSVNTLLTPCTREPQGPGIRPCSLSTNKNSAQLASPSEQIYVFMF